MTESSDKAILRSPVDWLRWFVNIRDQAKYEHIQDYINPDVVRTTTESTGTAMGSPETIGTTMGDTNAVTTTTTTATFPLEPSIVEDVLDASFKMQLKIYKRWEKKVKAIKSLDNLVIQTLGLYFIVVENYTSLYEKFKALKADVAPTDYACVLEVKKKYAVLQEGFIRNQKVLDWLTDWESTVQQVKQFKIIAITADIDATRTFLDVIEQTDLYFSASYILQINQTVERYPGKDLIKEFSDGVEIVCLFRQMYR